MGPRANRHPTLVAFGKRMRERRLERGLTQEQLAHLVGLDPTYISGIERGVRNVAVINVLRLAQVLKVEPGELLDGLRVRNA